jgi:phage FluMu gp28-like protein
MPTTGEPQHPRVPASVRPAVPLLPYQQDDVESAARFNWSCWSRQIGKSFTKSLRRMLRGLTRRRNQIFLSAGERQCRELMTKAQQHCRALQIAAEFRDVRAFDNAAVRNLEISLPNRVRIIGLPANPDTVRGFTGDVFLDEFAMHRDDREIWAAVFPSILRGDGELDIASTPKGLGNLFADLRSNDRFRHTTVTLYDAIDQGLELDPEEIRRSMNDDVLFRQEFLCEFLDEAHAFLTLEQIARCEGADVPREIDFDTLARTTSDCHLGVDIGRHRDLSVFWLLMRTPRSPEMAASAPRDVRGEACAPAPADPWVLTTLGITELRGTPFREQYEHLRRLLSTACVRHCCIDAAGIGMPLAEAAVDEFGPARVEPVTFTPTLKDRLATDLKRAVEDRALRIPADEAIRNDLHSVRRDVTALGGSRFVVSAGGDSHADRFWALALAVRSAQNATPTRIEGATLGSARFARAGIW